MKNIYETHLENGIRIVHLQHESISFLASFTFLCGSRHEKDFPSGTAHFLEHIFFRGCKDYENSAYLSKHLESCGGEANAQTSHEITEYWLNGHCHQFQKGFHLYCQMLKYPLFQDFKLEKQIILQELLDDYNEKDKLIDLPSLTHFNLFGKTPIGMPVAGTPQTVKKIMVEDLQKYQKEHYHSQNLIVGILSPLPWEECQHFIIENLKDWPQKNSKEKSIIQENILENKESRILCQNHSDNGFHFELTFATKKLSSQEKIAVIALERLLNDGMSSRLLLTLREKYGLVYSIEAESSFYQDCSLFTISAVMACENLKEFLNILKNELIFIIEKGIEKEEFEKMIYRFKFHLELIKEEPEDILERRIQQIMCSENISFEEELFWIENLQSQEIISFLQKFIQEATPSLVLVGPDASYKKKILAQFLEELKKECPH